MPLDDIDERDSRSGLSETESRTDAAFDVSRALSSGFEGACREAVHVIVPRLCAIFLAIVSVGLLQHLADNQLSNIFLQVFKEPINVNLIHWAQDGAALLLAILSQWGNNAIVIANVQGWRSSSKEQLRQVDYILKDLAFDGPIDAGFRVLVCSLKNALTGALLRKIVWPLYLATLVPVLIVVVQLLLGMTFATKISWIPVKIDPHTVSGVDVVVQVVIVLLLAVNTMPPKRLTLALQDPELSLSEVQRRIERTGRTFMNHPIGVLVMQSYLFGQMGRVAKRYKLTLSELAKKLGELRERLKDLSKKR